MTSIHVVAGVIRDVRGRILLARRTEGRDLAGLWEFPGGKVDAGETPEAALQRELREELGIQAEVGEALIRVPQAYPHKRIVLDVREIARWRGRVTGLDGQALAWVPPEKLAQYAMPPADRPVVAALLNPAHYLITPTPVAMTDAAWLAGVAHALEAGVRLIQLRAPDCEPVRWAGLVEAATSLPRGDGVRMLVNRDIALAKRFADGVHLASSQLTACGGRPLDASYMVAASCHDRGELAKAEALGCDFAVLGPVRETATHPGAAVLGWEGFAALREHVSLPIHALGGLQPADVDEARAHGAQGIAAIRGLWPNA